ncbi:unnamed protein product [Spodoptera littoralis]|uniref:Uncharacterized protein n=1 Tax=Spodoptera littoralis TaxID=7109 RepID=A0A9P0I369_SPOLI|nr:unnamed protein product [Spodoptera littoralis]CAH1638941.1 unnamed protein product [Spodoptera littoralis]
MRCDVGRLSPQRDAEPLGNPRLRGPPLGTQRSGPGVTKHATSMMLGLILTAALMLAAVVNGVEHRKPLISLRDMDFVGEDRQLKTKLGQCMAGLHASLDLSDLEIKMAAERSQSDTMLPTNDVEIKPDLLSLNLGHQRVNISMDYAELFSLEDSKTKPSNLSNSRRKLYVVLPQRYPNYQYPENYLICLRILEMMKQTVYSVQHQLTEVDPLIKAYESDVRFRMGYIFARLDEWKDEIRSLFWPVDRNKLWSTKAFLYYYERILVLNIDVTYTVEYMIHLHTEYMMKMEQILPKAERQKLIEAQRLKKEMEESKTTPPPY